MLLSQIVFTFFSGFWQFEAPLKHLRSILLTTTSIRRMTLSNVTTHCDWELTLDLDRTIYSTSANIECQRLIGIYRNLHYNARGSPFAHHNTEDVADDRSRMVLNPRRLNSGHLSASISRTGGESLLRGIKAWTMKLETRNRQSPFLD